MDEKEEQTCPNCKKDIPSVNFTIHMVHCARNICVCPVCKEAVPRADLQAHREALHVPIACKQCGEKVCGSDMEDHLRDSCEKTIRSCRYCELELPRLDLPAHEAYCGARTEQCPDCREWVMLKYRQLHLDSNHGFLRLAEDPEPIVPKKEPPKMIPKINNTPKPSNVFTASTSNGPHPGTSKTNLNENHVRTEIKYLNGPSHIGQEPYGVNGVNNFMNSRIETQNVNSASGSVNGASGGGTRPQSAQNVFNSVPKVKRSNDQPQVNTAVAASNKVTKELPSSRGAVKKRPAPKPPAHPPRPDPKRDNAYLSALQRQQEEERKRQEQSAYNMARGLPPVLSSAAKLEKLRKMDALHNRETEDVDYRSRLQGRVWMPADVPVGNVLGTGEGPSHVDQGPDSINSDTGSFQPTSDPKRDNAYLSALQRQQEEERKRQEQSAYNMARGLPPVLSPAAKLEKLRKMDALHNRETEDVDYRSRLQGRVWMPADVPVGYVLGSGEAPTHVDLEPDRRRSQGRPKRQPKPTRSDFENIQPMSTEEFMERFNELRVRKEAADQRRTSDRFSEIKSSLRELRRGLNEVTAPYNSTNTNENHSNRNSDRRHRRKSPRPRPPRDDSEDPPGLPCEFCGALVPAEDLVQHQTGCRPDLAQLRPRSPRDPPRGSPVPTDPHEEPVIPCEFCTESLPVYLITEHQERCRRESNQLYRD